MSSQMKSWLLVGENDPINMMWAVPSNKINSYTVRTSLYQSRKPRYVCTSKGYVEAIGSSEMLLFTLRTYASDQAGAAERNIGPGCQALVLLVLDIQSLAAACHLASVVETVLHLEGIPGLGGHPSEACPQELALHVFGAAAGMVDYPAPVLEHCQSAA